MPQQVEEPHFALLYNTGVFDHFVSVLCSRANTTAIISPLSLPHNLLPRLPSPQSGGRGSSHLQCVIADALPFLDRKKKMGALNQNCADSTQS